MSKYGYNGTKDKDGFDKVRCSFCGKPRSEVKKLIAGPNVYICNECVELCREIVEEDMATERAKSAAPAVSTDIPKPREIVASLDEYVIGQEAAKRALAVAVYNHYKRIRSGQAMTEDGVELQKSNIVMLGPTGSGKTLLAQTLAKILEGTVANVPPQGGRKHPQQECLQIDTTNILFICGGAFTGIEKIIERRTGQKMLGFGAAIKSREEKDIGQVLKDILPEDLLKFGLIPEFVGRVPVIVTLDSLDEEALMHILTEPKNALAKQYARLFEMDGVELILTEDALRAVAKEAIERKTGARGLRAIMEDVMLDVMYDIPSEEDIKACKIDGDVIRKIKKPTILRKDPIRLDAPKAARTHRKMAESKAAPKAAE